MGGDAPALTGPDLTQGVEIADVPAGGSLLGHAGGEAVLLVRPGSSEEVFAIGASCTHYHGPLAEGIVAEGLVRCPWHHARFDPRTGEAVAAPALDPVPCWKVERRGTRCLVGEKRNGAPARRPARAPESVVIVGAGAAGNAAAEMLRREGYAGPVTMLGGSPARPVDRPNLSKDYLAGTAPEAWVFLRDEAFYAAHGIDLRLDMRAVSLEPKARRLELSDGSSLGFGALLLATGADPVRLGIPGSDLPHVYSLRTFADSKAIVAKAASRPGLRAVVVGASFIGLEVAASLRTRGLAVDVVAPDERPLQRILGPELGDFIRALHEEKGVRFHLGRTLRSIAEEEVTLDDGSRLPADMVVVGIGVRPATALAEQAGLRVDRGVVVNEYLETSEPGIYAAGDIARFSLAGTPVRIEHWVVAELQGQTAAKNILGANLPFRAVPFFWSQHYDVPINYVGHAASWDRIEVAGSIAGKSCLVAYRSGGRIAAVASIHRDAESLQAEALMERGDQAGLEGLMGTGASKR